MRPRIAVFVLLGGVLLLGLLGALRSLSTRPAPTTVNEVAAGENTNLPAPRKGPAAASTPNPGAGGVVATTPAEDRAAQRQQDLDALSEAMVAGSGDASAFATIVSRLESPDAEVRTAARETAVHVGDTNIIPFLTTALQRAEDPREKVALMDAIEYLQLPQVSDVMGTNILTIDPSARQPRTNRTAHLYKKGTGMRQMGPTLQSQPKVTP